MFPLGENYFHFGLTTHSIIDLVALGPSDVGFYREG
eukprot:COSAG05_NODE_732_length_7656_cov_6.636628_4_plen_36_part_00